MAERSWPDSIDAPLAGSELGDATQQHPRLVIEVWMAGLDPQGDLGVLLLRRTPQQGGFWQGVSGRVEREDATLREAARREVREETGLEPEADAFFDLGAWTTFQGFVSGRWFVKRAMALALPEGTDASSVRLSDEHDLVEHLPYAAALGRLAFDDNRALLERACAWLQDRAGKA